METIRFGLCLMICVSMLAWSCLASALQVDATAPSGTIEEVLEMPNTADPAWISYVSDLIDEQPEHPRIMELRLHRALRVYGLSNEPEHKLQVILDLRSIVQDAGLESEVGYRAQTKMGYIYFHDLHDSLAAYETWKKIDGHPFISVEQELTLEDRPSDDRDALERDLRRITLYLNLVQSAFATVRDNEDLAETMRDEIDHYAHIVLAYPYFRGEELRTTHRHDLFQRFLQHHRSAGGLFVSAFTDDLLMLQSVFIFPHHDALWSRHRQRVEALREQAELTPQFGLERSDVNAVEPHDETGRLSEYDRQQAEGIPVSSSAGPASPSSSGQPFWLWVCVAASVMVLSIAVVFGLSRQKSVPPQVNSGRAG
ncbi:MAG: hypothetical protein AAGA29_03045 [Planctomycetota bacterium]